ncbi:putative B3 domain-containing protein At3g24850 [Lactuca sativa]|uniref:putative B3 domain-containing protein At3g24850 n=1 Tax=Lactuca sativa TaxID=4236 RepID=UPI000CACEF72|nr:putative B3 domain-containing protein At3g24850 [Lactuca sativa]
MNGFERKKRKSTPTVERNKKVEIVKNHITQELEEFITNELEGTEAKVVIQKTLFSSDLRKNQNRLSMPMKQLKPDEFLRKNEKEDFENGMELEVGLLGPRLEMHANPMMLKMWHMKKTKNYVLKTNWNEFVMANEKDFKNKENTEIQVWSFRRKEKLCFAITFLEKDVEGQNDAT